MSSVDTVNVGFRTKLGNLLRARFPFVLLNTWEEERARRIVEAVCRDESLIRTARHVFTWDVISGVTAAGVADNPDTRDPLKALDYIERCEQAAVLVVHDVEAFCGAHDDTQKAPIARRLKETASVLRNARVPKNLVFIGASARLPEALEKDVHVLDLHLPTYAEIQALLHQMIETNCTHGRIQLNLSPAEDERLVKSALGLTLSEAENAFAFAMVEDGQISARDVQVILEEKCQVLRKTDLLEFVQTDTATDDVGGLENLKHWLNKRSNAWLDEAKKYGLPAPRGIMLTGVPGCGKSLLAKAVGSAWQLPLLRLDPGKIYSSLMGASEDNIHKVIKTVEAISPCILWIDEIEKGFSHGNGQGDSGTSSRVFGSFLTWMQEKSKPVFVIATANDIEKLPAEFLRKGRFDEIFFVDLPNAQERLNILAIHLKKRLKHPQAIGDLKLSREMLLPLANKMQDFSGAEIEHVVISSLYEAFSGNRALRISDLENEIIKTVPLAVTQAEKISALRQWSKGRAVYASSAQEPHPGQPSVTPVN